MMQLATNMDPQRQIYTLLWMCYCADGAIYGPSPEGVARWAYLQALPHVCPATAARIAQGVLTAARAGERVAVPTDTSTPRFPDVESFRAFFA